MTYDPGVRSEARARDRFAAIESVDDGYFERQKEASLVRHLPEPVRAAVRAEIGRVMSQALKRSEARKEERRRDDTSTAIVRPGRQPKAAELTPVTAKRASQTVTHAEHSTKSRVGGAQSNCKERPERSERKGGGSGKAFVPWCDRRRR